MPPLPPTLPRDPFRSDRRELLRTGLWLAAPLMLPAAHAADVPNYPRAAFDAHSMPDLLKALGLPTPVPSKGISLQAPELSEDGAVIPVSVSCALPGVQRLLLCLDKNPSMLAALFEPGPAVEASFSIRVKMQQTSSVHAIAVLADGRVFSASREVRITLSGCVGAADMVSERPGQPSLIRVQPAPGGAQVRALMKHDMESGQRKDESGRLVPAWHIEEVVARLNGTPMMTLYWGPSVSRNPFLQFNLRDAKPGDRIAIAWTDSRGNRRSDEVAMP
jgi:sulfur-oxidizing protein SoxY